MRRLLRSLTGIRAPADGHAPTAKQSGLSGLKDPFEPEGLFRARKYLPAREGLPGPMGPFGLEGPFGPEGPQGAEEGHESVFLFKGSCICSDFSEN